MICVEDLGFNFFSPQPSPSLYDIFNVIDGFHLLSLGEELGYFSFTIWPHFLGQIVQRKNLMVPIERELGPCFLWGVWQHFLKETSIPMQLDPTTLAKKVEPNSYG
jgi:hypothetical protein